MRVIAYDPINHDYIYIGVEKKFLDELATGENAVESVKEYEDRSFYVGTDGVAVVSSPGPCDL
ncbi:hypothetical protein D3C83_319020 [compost metagenome]